MLKHSVTSFLLIAISFAAMGQTTWHDPLQAEHPPLKGRAWSVEIGKTYHRLPDRAKATVNPKLWDLALNSAGLSLQFTTDAPQITVRYTVSSGQAMYHMPMNGVSGVDLYQTDDQGRQNICRQDWPRTGDTIIYTFRDLNCTPNKPSAYELFFPLYNTLTWMEIGTPAASSFAFIPAATDARKPIVVYGTSIAQGACASRPAMAWTNIVQRTLQYPVVNLGFSGQGRLEKPMFDLLSEIDARIYIIDCLPNLIGDDTQLIYDRTLAGVAKLRKHSNAPIILVEHDGYMNEKSSQIAFDGPQASNAELRRAYEYLKKNKVPQIYYLTKQELGLSPDGQTDGVHASDLGMQQYADAYVKTLKYLIK